jgi:hypothetical protein
MEVQRGPIFLVRLRALPGVDAVQSLRAALKVLLRRFGLQCVSVEEETTNGDDKT